MINFSDIFAEFEQDISIYTITRTTVDFEEVIDVDERTQPCTIQPADKEKINKDTLDWTLEYIEIHSQSPLNIGEYISYNNKNYVMISVGNWSFYGFYNAIAEETKESMPW
jgi:hypothetical protein